MYLKARYIFTWKIVGPLGYSSAGGVKVLKEFTAPSSVPGGRTSAFIDDITVLLPPELAFDMEATAKTLGRVRARLLMEGITHYRK